MFKAAKDVECHVCHKVIPPLSEQVTYAHWDCELYLRKHFHAGCFIDYLVTRSVKHAGSNDDYTQGWG